MSTMPFLDACRSRKTSRVPVWYMRQAGRYQPEYREIRKNYSLLEICERPELCAQVTSLPVTQLGVDAAILFSDIMVPVGPMGVKYEIVEGRGPVVAHPLRTRQDVDALHGFDVHDALPYVLETIERVKDRISVPLIGFAGAPFTLASYMIEGGPSRDYLHTKAMMHGEPDMFSNLMAKLSEMVIYYLRAQITAGADAVQVFDSWAGSLSPKDYEMHILPHMQRIFNALSEDEAPSIYFGVGTGELLPLFKTLKANVIGVDWRVSIRAARERVGSSHAIQGNLDPALLLAPFDVLKARTAEILAEGMEKPGFIFNLGHGVFPAASTDTLRRLTEFVHEFSEARLNYS